MTEQSQGSTDPLISLENVEHVEYMLKKRNKTITEWENFVQKSCFGTFNDFKKLSTIKSNIKSRQDPKPSPDKSTSNKNITRKNTIQDSKDDKRFPKSRLADEIEDDQFDNAYD